MTADWNARAQQIEALFVPGCDPYGAGAAVLFGKALDAVTQDDRDIVKRVFMHMAKRRGYLQSEQVLRGSADMFHEVGSALAAEELLGDTRNAKIAESLRAKLRSRDQIKKITADGFERCVRALAEMGAPDVTIHECGDRALGEAPWSDSGHDD